jgi:hypothetical protein
MAMLDISDRSTSDCLVIEVEGAVSGPDYQGFVERFEEAVRAQRDIGLVVIVRGAVAYGDLESMREDWRFAFKDYHRARRVAFVGDGSVIEGMLKFFSWITRVEEERFGPDAVDAAISWSCERDTAASEE